MVRHLISKALGIVEGMLLERDLSFLRSARNCLWIADKSSNGCSAVEVCDEEVPFRLVQLALISSIIIDEVEAQIRDPKRDANLGDLYRIRNNMMALRMHVLSASVFPEGWKSHVQL